MEVEKIMKCEIYKEEAVIKLMLELEKGRISGENEGWSSLEEVRQEFGIKM